MTKLHLVKKRLAKGVRWYVYAWRGGPCIHTQDETKPVIDVALLDKAAAARSEIGGSAGPTFDTVIDRYAAAPKFNNLAPRTKTDYRLWLNRASERFGRAPLGAFNDWRMRAEIIDWRDTFAANPRKADRAAGTMAMLLGFAVENAMIATNVASGINKLHYADHSDEIWEQRHWEAVKDLPDHLQDAMNLARLTGLRLGDLVSLDWSQVGEKAIIKVTNKRKKRVVIPITAELRALLDARPHRDGAVLRSTKGTKWTDEGLKSAWQRKRPEGFDRRWHDIRGTYVTHLAKHDFTDEQIARAVGWSLQNVAEIRARYVDEERVVISMVEKLSA